MKASLIKGDSWTLNEDPTGASQEQDPEWLSLGKIDRGGGTVLNC